MLQLYTSEHCPYCKRVEAYLVGAGIPYEEKKVGEDPRFREELIEKGGKMQIPFLVDTQRGIEMYESDDILEYLAQHYAPAKAEAVS